MQQHQRTRKHKKQLSTATRNRARSDARHQLYLMAALASDYTSPHMDAIDRCLVHHSTMHQQCLQWEQTSFTPFEPALKRTEATCRHKVIRPRAALYRVPSCPVSC